MTLTKEWLLKTIAELEEERDATPGAVNVDAAMALAAMTLALASLESEAVALRDERSGSGGISKKPGFNDLPHGTPLYAAPPAPASAPDEHNSVIAEQLAHVLSGMDVTDHQRAIINCAVDRLNKNAEVIQQKPVYSEVPEALDYQVPNL